MKLTWDLVSRISKIFLWSAIIKSRENKLPPTKIQQKFTPFFTSLNFHEIGFNSETKTTIWIQLLLLSNTVHEIREKLFPRVKSEIQIRDFFPEKPEKSKIGEIKLPRKILRHTVNCEQVCFSCNLSAFVSRF